MLTTSLLSLVPEALDALSDEDVPLDVELLSSVEVVALVDVLVDGRFEQDEADATLVWRGSRNQVIHRLTPDRTE